MRTIVPALIACAAAASAVDESADRAIRQQESLQRAVSASTKQTADRADLLAEQLLFNRVGDASDAEAVGRIAGDLAKLVVNDQGSRSMGWVEDRLGRARRGETSAELGAASQGQVELIARLDELAKLAQGRLAAADGVQALRNAIEAQRRLQDETAKLADQTLGKERQDLSTQEKADLEKLARQERALDQALADAAKELAAQAAASTDEQEKRNLQEAAKQVEQSKAREETRQAADQLADNRLAEAQQHQEQVLQALERADQALAGAKRDEQAELDRGMQQLQQLSQQEQQLIDQLQQAQQQQDAAQQQAAMDRLRAQQQDIAQQLKDMQQQQASAQAQQAAQDLQQRKTQNAAQDMQKTLQAMTQAQQQMQQRMQQMRQQQTQQAQQKSQQQQQQPGTPGDGGLEDGRHQAPARGAWQVGLDPGDRETLNQARTERFPARYEQALMQYYQALAGEGAER